MKPIFTRKSSPFHEWLPHYHMPRRRMAFAVRRVTSLEVLWVMAPFNQLVAVALWLHWKLADTSWLDRQIEDELDARFNQRRATAETRNRFPFP